MSTHTFPSECRLIPINTYLVGLEGVFVLEWNLGEGGWSIYTHPTWKPGLTVCARPGLLFTLSRCGLSFVFLSNYPSLSESMCQSNSLECKNRALARAEGDEGKGWETCSLISTFLKAECHFIVTTKLKVGIYSVGKRTALVLSLMFLIVIFKFNEKCNRIK